MSSCAAAAMCSYKYTMAWSIRKFFTHSWGSPLRTAQHSRPRPWLHQVTILDILKTEEISSTYEVMILLDAGDDGCRDAPFA